MNCSDARLQSESGFAVYWVLSIIVASFAIAGVSIELAKYQIEGQATQYGANAAAIAASSQLCPVCDYVNGAGVLVTSGDNMSNADRHMCWLRAKHAALAVLKEQGFALTAVTTRPVLVDPEASNYAPSNNYYDFADYRDAARGVNISIERGMLAHTPQGAFQYQPTFTNGRLSFESLEFYNTGNTNWPRYHNWADSIQITVTQDSTQNPLLFFINFGKKRTHYQRTTMASRDSPSCVIDTRTRGDRPP